MTRRNGVHNNAGAKKRVVTRAELRAVIATLMVSFSLLLVPVTGGIGRLGDLDGDTLAQPGPSEDQLTGGFTWVDTVEITASHHPDGGGIWAHVPVGGISGIDCDDSGCLAVSDDPGQRGPVRAYPLDPATGKVSDPLVLTDTHGVPYRPGTVDPESIRLTHTEPPGMVWSAEGTPRITVADRNGRAQRTLPVSAGLRTNQGLEGLAVTSLPAAFGSARTDAWGDDRIITATELPPQGEDHSLITVYDGGVQVASYQWPGSGVSEILMSNGISNNGCDGGDGGDGGDGRTLLVLERGYTSGIGNSAVLWRTELTGRSGHMLTRKPVIDLAAMIGPSQVGNVEALAWWARPDGSCDLLVGTDNNFRASQRSVIHILRPEQTGVD